MTLRDHTSLHVYGPDGDMLVSGASIGPGNHIPREGELLKTTDRTEDTPETFEFTHDEMLVVSEVQTEFRLCENIGRGQSWQQLVYVHTERQEEDDG